MKWCFLILFGVLVLLAVPSLSYAVSVTDGTCEDWQDIPVLVSEDSDVSGGDTIDWLTFKVAHDADNLYFYYETVDSVDFGAHRDDYMIYLDTNRDPGNGYVVGEIGAEYRIKGSMLSHHAGGGDNWTNLGEQAYNIVGCEAEILTTIEDLGSPSSFDAVLFGNNPTTDDLTIKAAYTVPEPASFLLLCGGLFGLAIFTRKKK